MMRDCRTHKKNQVMGWIDYGTAYDMVSHSWIEEVMGILRIADNIKKLTVKALCFVVIIFCGFPREC